MDTYGKPGAYAYSLVANYTTQIVGKFAGGFLAGSTGAAIAWVIWSNVFLTFAVFAAAMAVAWVVVKPVKVERSKAKIGADKETQVARLLAKEVKNRGAVAVWGLQLAEWRGSPSDTDCVVSVPGRAVAVVEVKTGFGEVRVDPFDLSIRVGKRKLPGNPIRQVQREAADLERLLGCQVRPIVTVSDGARTSEPVLVDGVLVAPACRLPAVIHELSQGQHHISPDAHNVLLREAKKQGKRKRRP